jgi:hypothetical protein
MGYFAMLRSSLRVLDNNSPALLNRTAAMVYVTKACGCAWGRREEVTLLEGVKNLERLSGGWKLENNAPKLLCASGCILLKVLESPRDPSSGDQTPHVLPRKIKTKTPRLTSAGIYRFEGQISKA